MHPDWGVQTAAWISDKVYTTVLAECLDFEDVFSKKSAMVLPKHIEINSPTINLEEGKQTSYRPIYRPRPVELEILKAYI